MILVVCHLLENIKCLRKWRERIVGVFLCEEFLLSVNSNPLLIMSEGVRVRRPSHAWRACFVLGELTKL